MADVEPYICGISGLEAAPGADVGELEDLPEGWALVNIAIRRENPEWVNIENAIAALAENNLAMVPEEDRESARGLLTITARATFAALQAQYPRYVTESHEVHVSTEQLPSLMQYLGVEEAKDG